MSDSVNEVQQLLEKQRIMYETKLKELQRRQPQSTNSTQNQRSHRESSAKTRSSQASAPINPLRQRTPRSNQSFPSNLFAPLPLAFHPRTYIPPLLIPFGTHGSTMVGGCQSAFALNNSRSTSVSRNNQSSGQSTSAKNKATRARSATRSHLKPKPIDDEELNCPTCQKKYGVYIFQCSRGHSSCKNCKSEGARCGVCGDAITNMRNITLEGCISKRQIACSNADEGCCLHFKISEMEAHLKECPFNVIVCPVAAMLGSCPWRGKVSEIAIHFDEEHPQHRQGAVDTKMLIPDVTTSSTTMHLIQIGPFNFLMHIKVDEKESNIYLAVQLFGTSVSAAKWTYEIHIYTKNDTPKYQYTDICHPYSVSVEEIFKEAKCLTIPLCHAMNFIEGGCVAYKLYLKKDFGRKVRSK